MTSRLSRRQTNAAYDARYSRYPSRASRGHATVQPALRARVRVAAFVILAALTVASTGVALAADRCGIQSAGRPAWDRRTDDAVRLVVTFRAMLLARTRARSSARASPSRRSSAGTGGPSIRRPRPLSVPRSAASSVIHPSGRCTSATASIGHWIPRTSSSGTRSGVCTTPARPSRRPRRGECRRRRPRIARGRNRNRGRRRGHRRRRRLQPPRPRRPGLGEPRRVGRRQGDQQRRRRCERLHRRRQRLGLLPRRQDRPRPRRRLPRDARLGDDRGKA